MLLGFKRQFAVYVKAGSKTHTVRAPRKNRPKVGEICHCYTGLRQRGAELLGRFKCVRIDDITIDLAGEGRLQHEGPLKVFINGELLDIGETEAFFRRDGFRGEGLSGRQALEFWKAREFPFHGDLIHWEFPV